VARTFQKARVVGALTVLENVLLGCAGARAESFFGAFWSPWSLGQERFARARARKWTARLALGRLEDRLAADLSYGQQKLVSLACCLATGANIILLDEPISGIDSGTAAAVAGAVRGVKEEGRLVLLIEHDLDFVRGVADDVVLLSEGRVAERGPADSVLSSRAIVEAYLG
jgi:ABC-type branched-subunit amino acid transport system ATPase component